MTTLLISRVEGIRVIQIGESRLSIKHKKQDGTKKSGSIDELYDSVSSDEESKSGVVKTIDIAKGEQTQRISFYVFDRQENDALFKALYEKRTIEVTDKFKGTVSVYVDSIDVIDSDAHVNKTIYNIGFITQDDIKPVSVNFRSKVKELSDKIKEDLKDDITIFAGKVSSDVVDGEFEDDALNEANKGLINATKTNSNTGFYQKVVGQARVAGKITSALTRIKENPLGVANEVIGVFGYDVRSFAGDNDGVIAEVSDISYLSELSQFARVDAEKMRLSNTIVNKTRLINDLDLLLNGSFNNANDFDIVVDRSLYLIDNVGDSIENVAENKYIVKSFANQQSYKSIGEVDANGRTLEQIVYQMNGNLNDLDAVKKLNNKKDNDMIFGKVKVFL